MKTYISIYIFIMAFLLSACSWQTGTPSPAVDAAIVQPEIAVSTEKSDIEKQLEFLSANFEQWKVEEERDWWGYAVSDLDQNGRLEIISSEDHGTGHFITTSIREVNADFDGLILCGQDRSCDLDVLEPLAAYGGPQSCGPLITPLWYYDDEPQTYSVYFDSKANQYHYIFNNCINICRRYQNLVGGQLVGYGVHALALDYHLENPFDYLGGFGVDYQVLLVLWVAAVAIGYAWGNALSVLHTRLENRLYLPVAVPRIPFVHYVQKGRKIVVALLIAVNAVVDSDKAHTLFLEQNISIKSYFEIVAPEAAHVLY